MQVIGSKFNVRFLVKGYNINKMVLEIVLIISIGLITNGSLKVIAFPT